MKKAILVIDMPNTCAECKFNNTEFCKELDECPLNEVPNKKEEKQYSGNGVFGINTAMNTKFAEGYNACIDEILSKYIY